MRFIGLKSLVLVLGMMATTGAMAAEMTPSPVFGTDPAVPERPPAGVRPDDDLVEVIHDALPFFSASGWDEHPGGGRARAARRRGWWANRVARFDHAPGRRRCAQGQGDGPRVPRRDPELHRDRDQDHRPRAPARGPRGRALRTVQRSESTREPFPKNFPGRLNLVWARRSAPRIPRIPSRPAPRAEAVSGSLHWTKCSHGGVLALVSGR